MKLKIRPLTPNLWPALEDLFGENGACNGCWCMYWRIGNAYRKKPRETNKAAFHEVVKRGARAWSLSLAIWPLGGASLRPAMTCRGLIVHGDSGAWTMCLSGRSLAFMCARAIASRVLHPR